jgi:putative membrane protein
VTQQLSSASLADLVRYGLSNNGALLFVAIVAPLINQVTRKQDWLNTAHFEQLAKDFAGDVAGPFILMSVFILLLIFSGMLFSILAAIIKFYGYQLTLKGNNLKRHSGLLSKHEGSLNLNKLQAISYRTNFIGVMLKIENMICHQSTDSGKKNHQANNAFIIPARSQAQSIQISQTLFAQLPQSIEYQSISRRFISKTIAIWVLLPTVLLGLTIFLFDNAYQLMLLAPILLLLVAPITYQRWKRCGFALTDQYAAVQSGLFGYQRTIIPLFKVQRIEIQQSITQRRHNLSTLRLYIASGSYKIPYIPMEQAQQWFDRINYNIHNDPRPWF